MKKFAVTIVSPPGYAHSAAFLEVAESIHHGFLSLGHDSILTNDVRLPGRQHLVLGANLIPAYPQPLPKDVILYNLEQIYLGSPWLKNEGLISLFRRHRVWDYSPLNAVSLDKLGVKVERILPIGYVPELTRIPFTEPRDIDVLFFGSLNPRREAIIERLRESGLKVSALFGAYGSERDSVIGRSKLMLNVHYYEAKIFEIVRVSYLLANKCAVLSEAGADTDEETAFAGAVAFAPYEELVEKACELISDAEQRLALGRRGFELMSSRLTSDYLRAALAGL